MTDRLIILKKPFSPAQYQYHDQCASPDDKPKGLWYGCGTSWLEWIAAEMPQKIGSYLYKIQVDPTKILRISNLRQFDAFDRRYATATGDIDDPYIHISWAEVAAKHMGVEICPYQPKRRGDGTSWYTSWDVASGAIWDPRTLLGIERVSLEEIR